MKTIDEIMAEELTCDVFTISEFLEMLDMEELYDINAYGYYHDGEQVTDNKVWLNREDIVENGQKYPYIVWHTG